MKTTRLKTHVYRIQDGWLVQLCLMAVLLLFGASLRASADSGGDVITFAGGYEDPNDANIYVIDLSPDDLHYYDDDYRYGYYARVTFQRPRGSSATREASITVMESYGWSNEIEVKFSPGETEKTVELKMMTFWYGQSNGKCPVPFNVLRTNHADAKYSVLQINIDDAMTDEIPECTYNSQLAVLNGLGDLYTRDIYYQRWGNYLLFCLDLGTYVEVASDSRIVLRTRYADHQGLAMDADDYAVSKTREVVLTPINVGAVSRQIWYLYKPSDDEYLYSYKEDNESNSYDNADNDPDSYKGIPYSIVEAGPYKVANPTEESVKVILFSRADSQDGISYHALIPATKFLPRFSDIQINKTTFKSGETMVITAQMDNWQVMKRARQGYLMTGFGVTLDDGETTQPYRYTLDEETGRVTYYVTAPTVSTNKQVTVDFGPIAKVEIRDEYGDSYGFDERVITGSEGMFTVTVKAEAATPVPATSIDFVDLPADGSEISLAHVLFNTYYGPTFPLAITGTPADATDLGTVTYTVENESAGASLEYSEHGEVSINMGEWEGTVVVTATLSSGVSTSRTYHLTKTPSQVISHANTFLAGTTFPQFRFELNNMFQLDNSWDWTGAEPVHVKYTHANGTTWTEEYDFSKMTYHTHYYNNTDIHWTREYDLPFSFTEEHPNATVDQIGQVLVSAEVTMKLKNGEGHTLTAVSTATLTPILKDISFGDYYSTTAYYNDVHPVVLTSDVMYLPGQGFTVGYEIPELNVSVTYNSLSDEPVPDWLEVQSDGLYCTAKITVQPDLSTQPTHLTLYTLAQSSYDPDAAMQRYHACSAEVQPAEAEGHLVYRVNGQDVNSNLAFSNVSDVENIISNIATTGFSQADLWAAIAQTRAFFTIYDDVFEGATVTLSCEGETIQRLKKYKGCFTFMPPTDGRTYKIEVDYPGYGRHYENTFVSHSLRNLYNLRAVGNRKEWGITDSNKIVENIVPVMPENYTLSYSNNGQTYTTTCDEKCEVNALIYADKATDFLIQHDDIKIKVSYPDVFKPIEYQIKPELKQDRDAIYSYDLALTADNNYEEAFARLYSDQWTCTGESVWLRWDELASGNTVVTVVNSQGETINNATLNFACVNSEMAIQGAAGTSAYDNVIGGYVVATDPNQYAELIEVVADGYEPMLTTMYLWNYQYNSPENKGKPRRHTIVLQQSSEGLKNLTFETLLRQGNVKDNKMEATINTIDLLTTDQGDVLNYSETADYKDAVKHVEDPRYGNEGWTGTKYARLTGYMPYQGSLDLKLTDGSGTMQVLPTIRDFNQSTFTTFSQNYCMFDFDLTDQIAPGTAVQPVLKNGETTLAELPSLHNQTIDLIALSEANNVSLPTNAIDLTRVDNDAANNGIDMKDMNKAFDKFSFQMPPVLPFTVNIERNGDYFLVRAVCERNFIPGGKVMDALNKLDDLQYFDGLYQSCMDAVKSAKPVDDDFFANIPRIPSAFCGIKGFLSGIGYINREKGTLEINFYDGGVTFEASASASARCSFFIGGFGVSLDAKMAMTMALVNRAAAQGEVATLPRIDFVLDHQCRMKVCAWAYAGIDIWIAKATVGVRGGACIDLRARSILPTYGEVHHSGLKASFQAAMEAYAEVRVLWWKKKKSWKIFNVNKTFLKPNNVSNPLHPNYKEDLFSFSQQNVTKSYRKLKRRALGDLGSLRIISDVSGMARPTYMLGGTDILFNNLNTASDYNDDRLQVHSSSGNDDLCVVQQGDNELNAPMYDFAEARKGNAEVVAFEQVDETIDKDWLEAFDEEDQTKAVSERTSIYVVRRDYSDNTRWSAPEKVSDSQQGIASITPAVAIDVQNGGDMVVIWQQGKVMFNDEGDRYIDGSLMLSRYKGWPGWSEPVEIKRLNRRSVPTDYQVTMKGGEVLVMMTLKQDVNNPDKGATVVYLNVDADNKVRERYTMLEGSKPQMVNVNGTNMVGFLQQKSGDSEEGLTGRDIVLSTVNMKGEPTGELSCSMGMDRRMVNDFRIIADDDATSLDDVALLWTQSDQEGTTDYDTGTTTLTVMNRLYTSKLNSYNDQLYLTKPQEIATIPEDVKMVSMDGYLDGLDMKVAFCVANDDEGAAVLEKQVTFEDNIETHIWTTFHQSHQDTYDIDVEVINNGFSPVNGIEIVMGETLGYETSSTYNVTLMPQQSMTFRVNYPAELVHITPQIDIAVYALVAPSNSRSAKIRGRAAARPRRVSDAASVSAEVPVDMAVKVLSKHVDAEGKTTIVAEVNNASTAALADGVSCKVGLYVSPLVAEKAPGTTEVTLNYEDLYDATGKQNKVKIVTLTATQGDFDQMLYLRTTPMENDKVVTDVRPSNNVVPVNIKGRYILGDANNDGKVSVADVTAVINRINGSTSGTFIEKAANVNKDEKISIADVTGIINIINK